MNPRFNKKMRLKEKKMDFFGLIGWGNLEYARQNTDGTFQVVDE